MLLSWIQFFRKLFLVFVALGSMSIGHWLLISFIGRNFGAGVLGQYSFCLTTITTVLTLLSFGFRHLILTSPEFRHASSILIIIRAFILLLIAPLPVLVFSAHVAGLEVILLATVVLIAKIAESLNDLCYAQFQSRGKFFAHASSVFIRVISGGGAFLFVYQYTNLLEISVFALALSWVVVLQYDFRRVGVFTQFKKTLLESRVVFDAAIKRGWPLSITSGLGAAVLAIPNYFILSKWGEVELGFYAAAYSFVVLFNLVATGVGQVTTPYLSALFLANEYVTFGRVVVFLCLFIVSVVWISIKILQPIAGDFVNMSFGSEIAVRVDTIYSFIINSIPLVLSQFMAYVGVTARLYRVLLMASILSIMISLFCSIWLVPIYGVIGASWVLGAVGATHIVVVTIAVFRVIHQSHAHLN